MEIFIARLYRFGGVLEVPARTEEEARALLIDAYIKTYIDFNGVHPSEEVGRYGDSYLNEAISDIEIDKMELGIVTVLL